MIVLFFERGDEMSISSTVKKIMPYIKTASGYVLHRLSSQAVEMDDGTTLEEKVTSLNNLISQKVDTSTVVNNLLTTEAGFVLDARQGKALNDSISDLSSKLKSYETSNNGGWTVVKHLDGWTELHITAMIPRASTETYSLALNFPDGIQLRNAQTFITPARNGWNVANYYHNNDSQDSMTTPIDHTNLVFSAKTSQSLSYYFEVMVCGFES